LNEKEVRIPEKTEKFLGKGGDKEIKSNQKVYFQANKEGLK